MTNQKNNPSPKNEGYEPISEEKNNSAAASSSPELLFTQNESLEVFRDIRFAMWSEIWGSFHAELVDSGIPEEQSQSIITAAISKLHLNELSVMKNRLERDIQILQQRVLNDEVGATDETSDDGVTFSSSSSSPIDSRLVTSSSSNPIMNSSTAALSDGKEGSVVLPSSDDLKTSQPGPAGSSPVTSSSRFFNGGTSSELTSQHTEADLARFAEAICIGASSPGNK